jgi:hypothetical protein
MARTVFIYKIGSTPPSRQIAPIQTLLEDIKPHVLPAPWEWRDVGLFRLDSTSERLQYFAAVLPSALC